MFIRVCDIYVSTIWLIGGGAMTVLRAIVGWRGKKMMSATGPEHTAMGKAMVISSDILDFICKITAVMLQKGNTNVKNASNDS